MYLGMRTVGDAKDLADERCSQQANMVNARPSAVEIRKGYVKQNTTALDSGTTGLYGYRKPFDTTSVYVVGHSTKLETV